MGDSLKRLGVMEIKPGYWCVVDLDRLAYELAVICDVPQNEEQSDLPFEMRRKVIEEMVLAYNDRKKKEKSNGRV